MLRVVVVAAGARRACAPAQGQEGRPRASSSVRCAPPQDQIALGNAEPTSALEGAARRYRRAAARDQAGSCGRSRGNARAAVAFVLSGGDARLLKKLVALGAACRASSDKLMQGVLAYGEGRHAEAAELLGAHQCPLARPQHCRPSWRLCRPSWWPRRSPQGAGVPRRCPPAVTRHADRGGGLAAPGRASLRQPGSSIASRCWRPTICAAFRSRSTRRPSATSLPPISPAAMMPPSRAGWRGCRPCWRRGAGRTPRRLSVDRPRGAGQGQGGAGAVCGRRRSAPGRGGGARSRRRASLYEAAALVADGGLRGGMATLQALDRGQARRGGLALLEAARAVGGRGCRVRRRRPRPQAPSRPRTWPQPSKSPTRPASSDCRVPTS